MDASRTIAAVALGSLLGGAPAHALDQPIDGWKLLLRRSSSGETLVFVSRDADFLFPTPGGPDDPAGGEPGGAVLDLFSRSEGVASLGIPSGTGNPGWRVSLDASPRFRFRNADAPLGPSPARLVVMRQGRVLKVVAKAVGLPLAQPQGAVAVRLTTGGLRSCARFEGARVRQDGAGRFVAKGEFPAVVADCADATLAGASTTTSATSTTTTTTLAPCGLIPDPFEPVCGGACAAGLRCVGEWNPQLGVECACLADDLTPCIASGHPVCGGGCAGGRVCQAFHLLPGETPEIRGCACADPTDTCSDPAGTCFALGVCPAGEVCRGQGPPTSVCGCGLP